MNIKGLTISLTPTKSLEKTECATTMSKCKKSLDVMHMILYLILIFFQTNMEISLLIIKGLSKLTLEEMFGSLNQVTLVEEEVSILLMTLMT
jgi:hypothetical protein